MAKHVKICRKYKDTIQCAMNHDGRCINGTYFTCYDYEVIEVEDMKPETTRKIFNELNQSGK